MKKPGAAFLVALVALLAAVPAQAAQRPEPRIINGDLTPQGQYPWTVALVQPGTNRAFCGGTVIDENVILTAAHCTIGSRPGEIDVVAGRVDLDNALAGVREDVVRISLHPDAEGDSDDIVPRRDASLLTLDDPLPLSENIEIMPLGSATDADALGPGAPLDISGWGLTDPAGGDTEAQMQHATVERVSDASCASIFEGLFGDLVFSPVDQICAIADSDNDPETTGDVIDTCNGDSGGPLVSPTVGSPDPDIAAEWELIGVTSWGFDCASTLEDPDPNVMVPGVYARIADAQLHDYAADPVIDGVDDNAAQPAWDPSGGAPEVAKSSDESVIFCVGNPLQWDFAAVDQMEQFIRREIVPGVYETVSFTGLYRPDEGDAGDRFICEVHGRATGVGGYGLARSADAVDIADAPVVAPTIVETQIPVPIPGPVVTVPVPTPRVEDDADPRVRSVRRSCTRRRVCTFTISASDTGTGVKTVAVTLNTVRTRSCRRNGRRTVCASWRSTPLRARKVAGTASTFRVTTARLTRGSHVLHASAVDRAGNIQTTPRAVAFRLR